MALEVVVDKNSQEVKLGEIWDYREDPEGIIFHTSPSVEKSLSSEKLRQEKAKQRLTTLGYEIQPLLDTSAVPKTSLGSTRNE